KIGPDPRNFNQRVSLGRNDLLIRTFLISIYSFQAYARRGGAGGQQTPIDGPLSHIARRKGTSR
ncbi:hypothetical protein, partial [Klebsiella pneumoniae]|uniref:hypothetical protein n=1 Tax=Klebsiella pneumoniae TaxID=573 RepID=UPI001D0E8F42